MIAFLTAAFSFLTAAVIQGVPLLFGATGEIITEKSGNLNLGIPGIMYMGAISGVIGSFYYERSTATPNAFLLVAIPFLCCVLGAALLALIYSFLTVTLKVNQNVTGLAITTLGTGIGNFFGSSIVGLSGGSGSVSLPKTAAVYKATFLNFDEAADLAHTGFLLYLAIIVALVAAWVLRRTRVGLNLRAVGENPATADAAGINVTAYRYVATTVGGAIAGLGGLYFVMDYTVGGWTNNGFGDRGWLAIAIVIFALWRPRSAIFASVIFGGLYIACVKIDGLSGPMKELIKMLPYLVTIVILVITSARKKRENQPPESLGLNYFREER